MPVRITILAEDIAKGTEVLEYAISNGCAVERYENGIDSPLAASKKKKLKAGRRHPVKEPRYGGKYKLEGENEFQTGSLRFRGMESVRGLSYDLLSRVEWTRALAETGDYAETQAKSIISGLIKSGNLAKVA